VEAYFEGLVWDICRISDWRKKEVEIIVSDAGSEDDTVQIIQRLEEKGFIKQIARVEAAKYLRSYHAEEIWFFNINDKSSIKETRRALIKIFTKKNSPKEIQRSLF
jgi:glycosyltransferase involved in cell wall biosynthesis